MHHWGWDELLTSIWIKDRRTYVDLLRSSSPPSGRLPASSWRCSSPACAASTARSSRPPRVDGATTGRRSTGASSFRCCGRCFLSAFVVLAHLAIKAYDLVVALTERRARWLGDGAAFATFMYAYTFTRNSKWLSVRASGDHHAGDDLRRSSFPISTPKLAGATAR